MLQGRSSNAIHQPVLFRIPGIPFYYKQPCSYQSLLFYRVLETLTFLWNQIFSRQIQIFHILVNFSQTDKLSYQIPVSLFYYMQNLSFLPGFLKSIRQKICLPLLQFLQYQFSGANCIPLAPQPLVYPKMRHHVL